MTLEFRVASRQSKVLFYFSCPGASLTSAFVYPLEFLVLLKFFQQGTKSVCSIH